LTGFLSAGRAGNAIAAGNLAAEHGVLNATDAATGAIETQLGKAYNDVGTAGANVNAAAGTANSTLQNYLDSVQGNLAPGIASGTQGNTALQTYAASNPQFTFNPSQYLNSDAMKFQQQQGSEAITNSAAAQGLGNSGNTLKALDQYNQGVASTYYNNAFNQAQSEFQTNQNATLANLQALINSGNTANAQNITAVQGLGAPQASNIVNAANTNANLQTFLANLGLQGQEEAGRESMQGAQTAGNFAVGAAGGRASGILGQGAAISNAGADLGSLLSELGIG